LQLATLRAQEGYSAPIHGKGLFGSDLAGGGNYFLKPHWSRH